VVNLAYYAEIKALLDEVAACADDLSPNERELFHTLALRYEEPVDGSFDDKTCLELMLRNVALRASYGMKPGDATRQVDLTRKPGGTK
jgi:hypothetical protein